MTKRHRTEVIRCIAQSGTFALLAWIAVSANPASAQAPDATAIRSEEVQRYLEQRHFARFSIQATTTGPMGEIVDWVDPRQLDPDYDKRLPPSELQEPSADPASLEAGSPPMEELKQLSEAADLAAAWADAAKTAPAGTVPVIRPEFKYYVDGRSGAASFEEFLKSIPIPQPAGQDRLYATKTDFNTNIGTQGWVRYHNPAQVPASGMSLAQLGVFCWGGGPGSTTLEGIEVGIQENSPLYGDSNLHFFTYFRTHGGDQGDYIGGYNQLFDGFVPNGGAFPPGATVPNPPAGGSQRRIRAVLSGGAWWVQDWVSSTSNTWLGYYPVGREPVRFHST